MLLTHNLEEIILYKPALISGHACQSLKIVSAFTDCGCIMAHLISLKDGSTGKQKLYSNNIKIELILGMTKGNSLTEKKHKKICETLKRINNTRGMPNISCRYIYTGKEVHSKVYIWSKDNSPIIAYCGSANYTINAFQKRRECMTICDAFDANAYYIELLNDTVDCFAPDVNTKIKFSMGVSATIDEVDVDNLENLSYEDYVSQTPVDILKLSLLTASGSVGYGSGINWGIRPNGTKRDRNQAYIPYNVNDRKEGFFPDRIHPNDKNCPLFKVITKDAGAFYMRMAQQNNKGIHSAESNAILGKWLREKLGVASGTFITKKMLENYGTTYVVFKKFSNDVYTLDFEPEQ